MARRPGTGRRALTPIRQIGGKLLFIGAYF